MQNSTRMKVAAFVTSLALSLPGGTALATEATVALDDTATTTVETQETATQDAVSQDAAAQDATNTEVGQAAEVDKAAGEADANEAQAADAAEATDDEGLEPMASITTSDGTVIDLNNLNGYEPTVEELVDSLIASNPNLYAGKRDELIANYMDGYVNGNAQDPDRYKYYFVLGPWTFALYDSQADKWIAVGGHDEASSGTSDTTEESTVEASTAYFANYVSPTANTVADDAPAATATTTTAAVPATSDPTSFVGAAALAATSLGVFVSAKALRRK